MMTLRFPLRLSTAAFALLVCGATLSAQGRGFGPGMGRPHPGAHRSCMGRPCLGSAPGEGRGLRGLNLSEAQRAQMKAIHERHQASLQDKAEAVRVARKGLREAMVNPATEAKVLQEWHQKTSTAQFELMLERRALKQDILPLLTPEQRVQFEARWMGGGPRHDRE